jgi:hypothetical protein
MQAEKCSFPEENCKSHLLREYSAIILIAIASLAIVIYIPYILKIPEIIHDGSSSD